VPEVAGLLALAARLHVRRLAIARLGFGLLGAYLIAIGTNTVCQLLGVALDPGAGSPFISYDGWLAATVLLRLGIAVGWVLGAYRTTLILVTIVSTLTVYDLFTTYTTATQGNFEFFLFMLGGIPGLIWNVVAAVGVPALLVVAVHRKPIPAPRPIGFACMAAACVVQTAVFVGTGPAGVSVLSSYTQRHAVWLMTAACAATLAVYTRHCARHVLVTAVGTGLAAGWLLSIVMPQEFAVAVAATLCAGEIARATFARRLRARSARRNVATV
jgi:hypothetical protein